MLARRDVHETFSCHVKIIKMWVWTHAFVFFHWRDAIHNKHYSRPWGIRYQSWDWSLKSLHCSSCQILENISCTWLKPNRFLYINTQAMLEYKYWKYKCIILSLCLGRDIQHEKILKITMEQACRHYPLCVIEKKKKACWVIDFE